MEFTIKLVKCEEHKTKDAKSKFWDLAFEVTKEELTHYLPITVYHYQINFAENGKTEAIVYAVKRGLINLLQSLMREESPNKEPDFFDILERRLDAEKL